MTLAEFLPLIHQLSSVEKLRLIRILAEELDTQEDLLPIQPDKAYFLPTPYHSFGAGRALITAMEQASKK